MAIQPFQVADMDSFQLIHELVKSFNALADEVQNLTDRKTILEHKLRYAHEQVYYFFFSSSCLCLHCHISYL